MMQKIAMVAAVVLPLCNIPLIVRIIKRKSSQDISIPWAVGVWICLVLMFPSAFVSEDIVWKVYNIVNFILFSSVVVTVLLFRKKENKKLG